MNSSRKEALLYLFEDNEAMIKMIIKGRSLAMRHVSRTHNPDVWMRLPRHTWPKSWSSMEDPVVLIERNLCGHPLAGQFWERQFEKFFWNTNWKRFPIGNAYSYTVKKGCSYLCMWMTSNCRKETKSGSDLENTHERS